LSDNAKLEPQTIAVYGLSTEGYAIAAKLAAKGHNVSVIDETLGSAMVLWPGIAADYPELRLLLSEEPLLTMKTSKESISSASVLFFCPKLRRKNEELTSELKSRLTDVSRNLKQGVLFVYCLPLGIAGTKDVVDRIEHASGLQSGKEFFFSYAPLEAGKPTTLGCDSDLTPNFQIMSDAGLATEIVGISKAEIVHAQRLISRYSGLASAFEASRRLTMLGFESPREYRQVFADELSAGLHDLKVVVDSVETGDPFLYLGSGSLKSIEGYARFLVERIRELVKTRDLKAARLKIILFTDSDNLEMRGDKMNLANAVRERLQDFFSDIEYLNIMKDGFSFPTGVEKTNLMVFLSGSAEQRLAQLYEEQISMTKSQIIRANLPVEFVS
jgi:hypothetical protein